MDTWVRRSVEHVAAMKNHTTANMEREVVPLRRLSTKNKGQSREMYTVFHMQINESTRKPNSYSSIYFEITWI